MIKLNVVTVMIMVALLSTMAAAQQMKSAAETVDSLFLRAASGSIMFQDQVEPSKQALIEMGIEAIPQMLTKLDTRSAREMLAIVDIFKGIGQDAVEPLTGKLKARDDYVRRLAVRCLGEIKSTWAIKSLTSIADHPDFRTRAGVMTALGQIGDRRAAETVMKGLFDNDELVSTAAAVACGQIESGIDPIALIEVLDHPYFGVRYSAMRSLTELSEIPAGPLIQYIQTHPLDVSSGYAIEALGKTGSKDALSVFKITIESADWSIRAFTAEALGDLGQKQAEKMLKEALVTEKHPLVISKLKKSLAVCNKKS